MPPARTYLISETATLKKVWDNPARRVIWTNHGTTEMANDSITASDVEQVIRFGKVCWVETKKDRLWHVEGKDLDGRSIRIVLVVYPNEIRIKIVTAMTRDRK